jgi:hypothetical protein
LCALFACQFGSFDKTTVLAHFNKQELSGYDGFVADVEQPVLVGIGKVELMLEDGGYLQVFN